MVPVLLDDLRSARDTSNLGNKAQGLHWLAKHHLTIPDTLALSYAGSRRIAGDSKHFDSEVSAALAKRIDHNKSYAVRSSANLEDGPQHSFAGQFITLTNISGLESIQDAIRQVISSNQSEVLDSYFQKLGKSREGLEMGVLIQEMVQPVLSGVAFSKNPTTGLDEIVIEAVEGLGEALVQGGVTPERWIYRWGQFSAQPSGKNQFRRVILKIALETKRIARLYGSPIDLEWAYDGRKIYWLQVRPITMLPKTPLYSNRIAKEVLPGIIKPLISSINIPLVNTAWIRLFDQLLGTTDLKPEELTRIFHYRAYFNMASVGRIFELLGFPAESLEMLLGLPIKSERPKPSLQILRHLPRMLRSISIAISLHRNARGTLIHFEKAVHIFQQQNFNDLSEEELIEHISSLFKFNTDVAYYNIIIPLMMNLFNALLKKQLEKNGIDFGNFDVTSEMESLTRYDPNAYLDSLKEIYLAYPPTLRDDLASLSYDQLQNDPRFQELTRQLGLFVERFGHLSDSGSDFSSTPWRENRDALIQMVINHSIKGRGQEKITWETADLSLITRWQLGPIYDRARKLRLRREQVSSIYTSSYGWFRVLFSALADKLISRGVLSQRDDIFYLSWQEIQALVQAPSPPASPETQIQRRKKEVADSRDVLLPETIYGNTPPPLTRIKPDAKKRTGIPTSPGYYQGPLKVVRSTSEFDTVEQGDVIAIPHSDVAWTPLFAKAGAVIAEAGGMLSHSSIVAREYGIPCVVSVNGATTLPGNVFVYVDAYQGEISIVEQNGLQEQAQISQNNKTTPEELP